MELTVSACISGGCGRKAAGERRRSCVGREDNRPTSTFLFRFHKPCRPRHIVVQVLLCCNYVPGIALEMAEELKITCRPLYAEHLTQNKETSHRRDR